MGSIVHAILDALKLAGIMGWDILWGLNLGFLLSAVVDAAVSKNEMARLLPDSSARSIGKAMGLGAASSSCSYAAVAMARSIFRKGGNFTAAMAFEFAATNLVIELGILLAIFIGWQFTLAEFVGGPIMIALIVVLFRLFLRPAMVERARRQTEKGLHGSMEGHAEMSVAEKAGSLRERIFSPDGITAVSHYFVMNWQMLWKDIVGGLLIAGALGAWLPKNVWEALFLSGHQGIAVVWGAIIGPIVAIVSFVCSIGNVPLALILWNGGISFGGVVAFLFADLLIIPILNIYRKYYGGRMTFFLFITFYAAMVASAIIVELVFKGIGLVPTVRGLSAVSLHITLNYTAILNIIFLLLVGLLAIRFVRSGGPEMMRMMAGEGGHEGHEMHHHGAGGSGKEGHGEHGSGDGDSGHEGHGGAHRHQ